ncbi:MAG: phosphoribosyltransferase family protein [Aquificaceae bacterium]|nr:phosphoribosyltransferase family protein [Aquificaceae bacterium]MDW8433563.1 phosphoribosyltransferase family protein [Aquificaceae bacterium]
MIGLLQSIGLAKSLCSACGLNFVGKEQGFLCESCLQSLKPYHPMDYSKRIEYVFSYRIYGLYKDVLKEVIQSIKFENSKRLAHRLGGIIKEHIQEYIEEVQPDLITYPSLNLRRLWSRGFNHMEEVLKGAGVPAIKLFKRRDFKPPLAYLDEQERARVVKEHRLKEEFIEYLQGKRVLIVDDLLTTGSTIKRLAYLLMSVGAEEVHAYFIAKA